VKLKEIPPGSRVFIDANIFLFPALNDPRFLTACRTFLQRVSRGEVRGFTSVFVLNEVLHKLMVAEVAKKYNLRYPQATHYLQKMPKEVKQLAQAWQDMGYIKAIPNLTVLDVSAELYWKGIDQSKAVGLLAMDGAHVAVMEAHGLTDLASNDTDFQRISWIKFYQPERATSP